MAGNEELRELLAAFTAEVENDPRLFGKASTEFIKKANEAIGVYPRPPLTGWVVPRGYIGDDYKRIAGIEIDQNLRNGVILDHYQIISCADGMHADATDALTTLILKARARMDELI